MAAKSSPLKIFRTLLILCTLTGLVIGGWFLRFASSPFTEGRSKPLRIEVRRGLTPIEITRTLESERVIADGKLFHWLGRITRAWGKIKAGEYDISARQTPLEIFATLESGISIPRIVTIPEGHNRFEIADEIARKQITTREAFLAATTDSALMRDLGLSDPLPASLEGYLFPETYHFDRTMSAQDIVRTMARKALSLWTPERAALARERGLSQQETMTLASMIEKETGHPPERPIISSVFHNRLRKRMRLQSDPTTIYGIWETYRGNIRRQDLLTPTPYNTYTIPALPIGPIGNPGAAAIDAALSPATTDSLYFVSRNDGTHEFNPTYEGHALAVRKLQIDPRARSGKSWRDLSKKSP